MLVNVTIGVIEHSWQPAGTKQDILRASAQGAAARSSL